MRNFLQKIKALFTKSETEKTSLQKTARISIIFAAIAVVALIVYLAVVAPLLRQDENYVPELFEGEVYSGGSLYILRPYEREEIASIKVKNDVEEYTLIAYQNDSGDTEFMIEGSETMELSYEQVSYFITDARNLITNSPAGQERVTETATEEDLKNYGLDEASDPAWFEVTLNEGGSYRIYVGNPLVTTTGYYVMLEGRKNVVDGVEYDIVYALQSSLSSTVLSGSATLISLELAPYDTQIYQATLFALERQLAEEVRDQIAVVGLVSDLGISASSRIYEMYYPAAYVINEDAYSSDVLSNLAYVTATEIVAYGSQIHNPEVCEAFGLDLDYERLEAGTDKNYAMIYYSTADVELETEEYEDTIVLFYFSEKQTDLEGTEFYYVYSPMKEVIGKVDAETFGFVEWTPANFTSPYIFYEYFTSCEFFEIVSEREDLDYHFALSGKERTRVANVTTSDGEIVYKTTDAGGLLPLVYESKYKTTVKGVEFYGDFEILRDLYYVLITRTLALYAEIDESETVVDETPYATIKSLTSPKDHPITYYIYEQDGTRGDQVRDEGGNILCHEVIVPTTLSDGTVKNITYEKAYYDESAKRFFLKAVDSNDNYEKPAGYEATDIGTVKVNTFLPMNAYGAYQETLYTYEIYDLYDQYTDYDGNMVSQMNSTYKYIVPSTEVRTYLLTSGGERELISTETERAELGVYIRTATIEKLFSDTHKLLNGEEIDTMGLN